MTIWCFVNFYIEKPLWKSLIYFEDSTNSFTTSDNVNPSGDLNCSLLQKKQQNAISSQSSRQMLFSKSQKLLLPPNWMELSGLNKEQKKWIYCRSFRPIRCFFQLVLCFAATEIFLLYNSFNKFRIMRIYGKDGKKRNCF